MVGPRNRILTGSEIPQGEEAILGLSSPLQSIGSLCCGVRCKRDYSLSLAGVTLYFPSRETATACDAAFR